MFLLCRCGGLRGGIAALHDFHPLLPCQALGQALVLCRQGRGGFHLTAALWIPAYAGMTDLWLVLFTLTPVSGTGTGFGPLSSRERGILSVVLDLFTRVTPHPVDSRLRGNDGYSPVWWYGFVRLCLNSIFVMGDFCEVLASV